MTGMLLRSGRVSAWLRRHRVARLEHVVRALVDVADVQSALETRGIHDADVIAVLTQLQEDIARCDDDDPDTEPPFDPALDQLTKGATVNGLLSTTRFVEGLAAALPPELAFVRRPLAACAGELGATFDAVLSSTKDGSLTFDAWDPQLKTCVGLMQQLSDKRWQSWQMSPMSLFVSLLSYKPYFAYFKERGHDPVALVNELAEGMPKPTWPVRPRPASLTPSVNPALFALLLRSERYAAADATDVRLRHLLHALHDERAIAPWIDRLASAAT